MAEFSDDEKKLLQSIPAHSALRTSLSQLREASETIWLPGGPRIIPGYTDHGIPHSKRIAGYAVKLLKNYKSKLSEEEMYLLMAGIYLHDIGMQCDVVRHPEIKKLAETDHRVEFKSGFVAKSANNYSIEEQKAIRDNHHYLSVAWIAYAKRTGKTVLGPHAQSIPNHLVGDLIDVCKHHTGLPIDNCPEEFERGQSDRKRLVAALLRFADELDIDANRVKIEIVQDFNLDPSNAVYWWLHNQTHVTFPKSNLVRVQVWMHPDDVAQYREIVESEFIGRFRRKNAPVIRVLAEKGISIVIHDQSGVKETLWEKPFPPEIHEALQAISKQPGTSSTPAPIDRIVALRTAAGKLRLHLDTAKAQLADPDLRPEDCDTAISELGASQRVIQEIQDLLSAAPIAPDLVAAASEFRVLGLSLNQRIVELTAHLLQFRNHCPPVQPADKQRRELLFNHNAQLLRWLGTFESVLPVNIVTTAVPSSTVSTPTTAAPSPTISTPTTSGVSPAPVPVAVPELPPPSQKFDSLRLARLLSNVDSLSTKRQRTQITDLLKKRLDNVSIGRNKNDDFFDILAIVNTCRKYDKGLGYLIAILREIEHDSTPLRKVTEYLAACNIPFDLP